MADFDDDFVGIDESAYAATRPVDTWLRHRMRSNYEFVNSQRRPVVMSYMGGGQAPDVATPAGGDRAWASPNVWSYPVVIPYWVDGDTLGAEVTASLAKPDTFGVEYQSEIWRQGDRGLSLFARDTYLGSIGTTFEGHVTTPVIRTRGSSVGNWGQLRVGIRSAIGADFDSVDVDSTINPRVVVAQSPHVVGYGLAPIIDGPDTACFIKADGTIIDILGTNPKTNTYYTSSDIFSLTTIAQSTTLKMHTMGWLQCRSIGINPVYAGGRVDRGQLQARQIESGETASALGSQVIGLRDRKQLIAWGPSSYRPFQGDSPNDLPTHYRVVQSSAVAGSPESQIICDPLWMRGAGGGTMKVTIAIYAIVTATGLTDAAESVWTVRARIGSPNGSDTDWTSPITFDEVSVTKKFVTIPARPVAVGTGSYAWDTPFVRTNNWIRGQAGTNTDLSHWLYGHREGQLGDDDISHINLITLEINTTSGLNTLRVDAAYQSGSLDAPESTGLGYKHCFHCVGWSVWASGF